MKPASLQADALMVGCRVAVLLAIVFAALPWETIIPLIMHTAGILFLGPHMLLLRYQVDKDAALLRARAHAFMAAKASPTRLGSSRKSSRADNRTSGLEHELLEVERERIAVSLLVCLHECLAGAPAYLLESKFIGVDDTE